MPRREVCALAGEDGVRLGLGLQSRRDVDRIAGNQPLAAVARRAGNDLAGVDSDPHPQRQPMPRLELLVELLQPLHHLHGRAQSALGVVLAHGRHSEDGHHRVADELFHGAAPRVDGAGHGREVRVEHRAQTLRIEAIGQRGRTHGVGEKDSYELSLHQEVTMVGRGG